MLVLGNCRILHSLSDINMTSIADLLLIRRRPEFNKKTPPIAMIGGVLEILSRVKLQRRPAR